MSKPILEPTPDSLSVPYIRPGDIVRLRGHFNTPMAVGIVCRTARLLLQGEPVVMEDDDDAIAVRVQCFWLANGQPQEAWFPSVVLALVESPSDAPTDPDA